MKIDEAIRKIYYNPISYDDKIESVTLKFKWEKLFGRGEQYIELDYNDFHSILEQTIDKNLEEKEIQDNIYKTLSGIHKGELYMVTVNTQDTLKSNYGNSFSQEMSNAIKNDDYVNWRKSLYRQRLLSKSRRDFLKPGVIKI